jgi:hypothetical protein
MGPRTFYPTAVSLSEPSECEAREYAMRRTVSLSHRKVPKPLRGYDSILQRNCQDGSIYGSVSFVKGRILQNSILRSILCYEKLNP